MEEIRTGLGYDRHRFDDPGSGPLRIGCVSVEFDRRLDGHSDGDLIAHCIADALLSAAGIGDLGTCFPAGKPETAGISGSSILRRTADWLASAGWRVGNIDCTVICDEPCLGRHVPVMQSSVSTALGIDTGLLSIKPRHAEGLGFAGRMEGIEAMAIVLLVRNPNA